MIEVERVKPNGLFTNYIFKAIPLAFDESMSYYECLCGLLDYMKNTMIPALNNNADAMIELQGIVQDLQTYVANYFDNLDVQEEINNKLDAMVEDGTLPEIIADYLNAKAVFGFDTVADMKASTNLINGSYVQTLGYYNKNDDGGALYKIRTITNDDVVDNMFIIALDDDTNNLVAEIILNSSYIKVNQAGLKADDNTFNNTPLFISLLSKCNTKGLNIEFNKGVYNFDTPIVLDYRLESMIIKGQGLPYEDYLNGTTLKYTGNGYFITFNNCWKCTIKDLQVESNENGFDFAGVFYLSHLNHVHFKNNKNAILLKQFAYAYLDNIVVNTNNANSEFALQVGDDTTDLTEYLFVNGFINEDDDVHSANNGIVIKKGIHLNFENMDLVKKFNAIKIEPIALTRYVFFNNVDIARCHIGYNINALNTFSYVSIKNSMCAFRETADSSDRFILLDKASGKNISNFTTENIGGVKLGENAPAYMIEVAKTNVLVNSHLTIDYNNDNLPCKVYLSDSEENVLAKYYQPLQKVNRIYNNSGTKTCTITLLTNSPYNSTPWVQITSNKPVIKTYTISNTNGGNLTATITITDDFTTGNFVLYSSINPGEYAQQSLNA